MGLDCGMPAAPLLPPKPTPAAPVSLQRIFFNLRRPFSGESIKSFTDAATPEGNTNFDALVKALQ